MHPGVKKQLEFLNRQNDVPVLCPSCGKEHSYLNLINHEFAEWADDSKRPYWAAAGKENIAIYCPETRQQIVYVEQHIGLLGQRKLELFAIPDAFKSKQ